MNVIEKHFDSSKDLILLLHGQEASSNDWIINGGFINGAGLTDGLTDSQFSWIAPDLYGHGSFKAEENDFDPADISDELWPVFLKRSADTICNLAEETVKKYGYQSLTVVSYSASCHVAVRIIKHKLSVPIKRVFMAAPCPEREYDDEYSLHNNLDCFNNRKCCFFAGTRDEEVPIDDVRWFFSHIESDDKELLLYDSGHSLPEKWTSDALIQLGKNL
ncbi:MAG: hypothetical protein JXK07_09790 [Spirochaetes bacterium]|nr:hypothetical protein [Spirochaetota bacterium]MBN2769463.1 hypothetical protein [Spirochaetota bacterium]